MTPLTLALAAGIGLALGALGGGGSVLTVPVLVYVLGQGAKQAVATSLAIVGVTSVVAAAGHWRAGHVRLRLALPFGAVAMLGAFAGARLAAHVSDRAQLAVLAAVMLAAAAMMLRPLPARPASAAGWPALLVAAPAVGVLTGLVGVGGGFLVVPALVTLGGAPMKEAVGASLVVIAMNSAVGLLGYLGRVPVDWGGAAAFAAAASVGTLAGTRLARRASPVALRRAFAGLLVVVGAFVLYQNRGAPHRAAAADNSHAGDAAREE